MLGSFRAQQQALRLGTIFVEPVWIRVYAIHTEQWFTQELTREGPKLRSSPWEIRNVNKTGKSKSISQLEGLE